MTEEPMKFAEIQRHVTLTSAEFRQVANLAGIPPAPDATRAVRRSFERRLFKALAQVKGRMFAERARRAKLIVCDHHMLPDDEYERGGP